MKKVLLLGFVICSSIYCMEEKNKKDIKQLLKETTENQKAVIELIKESNKLREKEVLTRQVLAAKATIDLLSDAEFESSGAEFGIMRNKAMTFILNHVEEVIKDANDDQAENKAPKKKIKLSSND